MAHNDQLAGFPPAQGLYSPASEHDSCGVGFVVQLDGVASHRVVEQGVEVLQHLLHRGAIGGDQNTGDGAGIQIQIPDAFLREATAADGLTLPAPGCYGVGMVFLPRDKTARRTAEALLENTVREEKCEFLGWRDVPVEDAVLGEKARTERPVIRQCFVGGPELSAADLSGVALAKTDLELKLYSLRKLLEQRWLASALALRSLARGGKRSGLRRAQSSREARQSALGDGAPCYLASFSSRTIVYKGLLTATQLPQFYPELGNPTVVSAIAVVHQRFSTNTFPTWQLAQPFRYLAHNGEINTLRGNLSQMHAREQLLSCARFNGDLAKLLPVIVPGGSDSASLDNVLELLVAAGRSLPQAMMMLIPEAWGIKYPIGPDQRGFFEYHAGLMEPWDGPAAVVFSDGRQVGALLDRNGLRPARYTITRGGLMVMASETGVLSFPPETVLEKGALRPGQMILVDLERRRVLRDGEIKAFYSRRQPYRRWVEENKISLHGFFDAIAPVQPDVDKLLFRQKLFGYTREERRLILEPMISRGNEAVGSMGADTPLAVFSEQPQLLYNYFRQLFAQVTNPPLDSIREELVMSLMTFIGNPANILTEVPQHSRLVKLRHPVLSNEDLYRLRTLNLKEFMTQTLTIGFPAGGSGADLERALERLGAEAEAAVSGGRALLILSDRDLPENQAPIPALLAVSAVNQHLIRASKRTSAGLILETGEAREVMHLALLLGYGATAVNPWLAFEVVADMVRTNELSVPLGVTSALDNYIHALCKGLLKIMSKMGISTLRSYRGAQVFEAIGLGPDLVKRYFSGTASRVAGIGLDEIAAETNERYSRAYDRTTAAARILPAGGRYQYRADSERHLWTPEAISKLQQATRTGNRALYRQYAALINDQTDKLTTLRGMLRFKSVAPVPLGEVEEVATIVKRFVTGAMSFGSISPEAHETLAIAMNRLQGMSNCGEGGEDPARYTPQANGDNRCSATKQVASGRFGVTATYLVNARELQIKIAQGAKPGEGGQLPGYKVNQEIARLRHSTPGVTLISPPPHHDIYSIEDIAQLIYDLKNVNPQARISVKLVSEIGVGTVAAGVAKARADVILISGSDGGTGASPLSSIQYAGMPWELGLAETQQTLVLNRLRQRVRLQVDGQIKTGRDVVIAALLGAEEFGFATAPLVVCGCVMMRHCHKNTCPTGVATQNPILRQRFNAKPEHVIAFFTFVAEEVRELLASLGLRTLDEAIGRCDLLEMNPAIHFRKAKGLDLSAILYRPKADSSAAVRCTEEQEHGLNEALDLEIIPQVEQALAAEVPKPLRLASAIRNVQRAVGARLSGMIAKRYGDRGLPEDTITWTLRGSAGQSFGAFAARGLTLILEGEANDYLGKGLSGGRIIVKAPPGAAFDPARNVIAGNVLLYGATSGEAFINGCVGERFAVRNSGALAVVEGVGDHGCEYMTGGRVVVLGSTGLNFAAGMSGGIAYVYDENRSFDSCCNLDMVDLESVIEPDDIQELRGLIERHHQLTGSRKAKDILERWQACLPYFIKVFPMEYRRVLGRMTKEDEATERQELIHG